MTADGPYTSEGIRAAIAARARDQYKRDQSVSVHDLMRLNYQDRFLVSMVLGVAADGATTTV